MKTRDLLDKMALFIAVVDAGSLSAAARAQRLSVAAVSRRLQGLEVDLGVALLRRGSRHLAMTAEGQRLYDGGQAVLAEIERLREGLRPAGGLRGSLRLSVAVTFGLGCIVPLLPTLRARHPGLDLEVRLEDHLIDLSREGVDLAIRVGAPPPDSGAVAALRLPGFRRAAFAAPGYLSRRCRPQVVGELAEHEALLHATPTRATQRWRLARAGEVDVEEVEVRGALCSNNLQFLHDVAVAGLGVAMLPEWLAAATVATGGLVPVLPGWRSLPVQVFALHRPGEREAPRLRAVLEHLREGLRARLGDG